VEAEAHAMTRRHLLAKSATVSFAAVLVGSSVAEGESTSGVDTSGLRAGRIARVTSPWSATFVAPAGGPTQIVLAGDAKVSRGTFGEVGDLAAFVPGDEIVVVGEEVGSRFVASEVQSLYHGVSGEVLRDSPRSGILQTSAGPLYFSKEVRERCGVGRLARGDRFTAEVWKDPKRRRPAVMMFRVESAA
jgi:hypothetical protein